MEKSDAPKTLGQAIDAIIDALESMDPASQVTAIRAACEHHKIRVPEGLAIRGALPVATPGAPEAGVARPVATDIRTLKQEKQPSSANEMAALVAFYLSEVAPGDERKTEVAEGDVIRYFKQAGFALPKFPRALLPNAKNAGYFDFVGKGRYRLNAVGYNLVAHNLPRGEGRRPMAPAKTSRREPASRRKRSLK